jgi:hypothetical protein
MDDLIIDNEIRERGTSTIDRYTHISNDLYITVRDDCIPNLSN